MNQKKCPKCGELNPPEAVMCWACYTPLTGAGAGAAAGPAAGGRAVAAAAADEDVKKPAATPAQMGVIGVALLVGLLYGGYAMFGGGGAAVVDNGAPATKDGSVQGFDPNASATQAPTTSSNVNVPPPPSDSGFQQQGSAQNPTPSFSVVAAPSPDYKQGALGILAASASLTPAQGKDLARRANQLLTSNRWTPLAVYIFKDTQAANQFKEYQTQRGNRPLGPSDYQTLAPLWGRTFMFYQYSNGQESTLNPASGSEWWKKIPRA